MNYTCIYCNLDLGDNYQPKMCCNGYMCGCMGQPVEPIVCSPECFILAYPHMANNEIEKKYLEQLKLIPKDQLQEYLKKKYLND